MAIHNVRLPETFSAGSLFGVGFRTRIVAVESGAESRVPRFAPSGRRRYNLSRGIASVNDLRTLMVFFMARGGSENTFRVKDWLDYATTPTGTIHQDNDAAITPLDVTLDPPAGDGTRTQFQLVVRYVSGDQTVVRPIIFPVAGTVRVSVNDVEATTGWTVSLTTGVVTFTTPPTNGHAVKAGFQFDVPVRFDPSTEEALQIAIQAITTGELPDISCTEDLNPVKVSQDRPMGGCRAHGAIVANVQLSGRDPVLNTFNPTTTGLLIFLPDTDAIDFGGPIFRLANLGSQTLSIRSFGNLATIGSLASGQTLDVYLGVDGVGAPTWYLA